MSSLQIVVLAIIQGLTEFLPVSSSAHLVLGSRLFGWPDQGLVFDVATHLGTLLAVVFYFRRDLAAMLTAWTARGVPDAAQARQRRLGALILGASVPVLVIGGLLHGMVENELRNVRVIALTTLVFGALLWLADARGRRTLRLDDLGWRSAMLIGAAQVLALVPGVSRSGITITAGRALGFDAESAARFSFLLSIPVIAAAGAFGAWQVAQRAAPIDTGVFLAAVALAAVAGWACIAAFLALLKRVGLVPFILYRLALGALLLAWWPQ